MSPTGSGKPLFDLIPRARQPYDLGPDRSTHIDHPDDPVPPRSTGRLVIPTTWLYIAIAGVILLLILAYRVGYGLGQAAEQAEMLQLASRDANRVLVDPLADEPSAALPQAPAQQTDKARPENPIDRAEGMILTADGPVTADPRIKGSNYLELATLPRALADEAVRYLASVDVEAIAVPADGVDRGSRGRNTSGRYRVIALGMAVPGDRFSSSSAERERFERRISRLGKAWAEQGGASDFSDPLWRRFGG